jgi:excisionase family DNA binding protein
VDTRLSPVADRENGAARHSPPSLSDTDGVLLPLTQQAPYLNVRQVARLLCVSTWVVYEAIRLGDLPVIRWGRRVVVDRADLAAFVESKRDPGRRAPVRSSQRALKSPHV